MAISLKQKNTSLHSMNPYPQILRPMLLTKAHIFLSDSFSVFLSSVLIIQNQVYTLYICPFPVQGLDC